MAQAGRRGGTTRVGRHVGPLAVRVAIALAVVHVVSTGLVIVAAAHHDVLDAVAGTVDLAIALGLAVLFHAALRRAEQKR